MKYFEKLGEQDIMDYAVPAGGAWYGYNRGNFLGSLAVSPALRRANKNLKAAKEAGDALKKYKSLDKIHKLKSIPVTTGVLLGGAGLYLGRKL